MSSNLVFTPKTYPLENLINDIDTGNIALPDLQRPFVWSTTKARDLIDSLYQGLPVGLIILWEILEKRGYRKINQNNIHEPRFLVIDGQQRLTSLYSIIKDRAIVSKTGRQFKIKIAFNPLEERFEVANPAIKKDPRWIANISELFINHSSFVFINNYLKRQDGQLDQELIAKRIEKVRNILNYPFSVLELSVDLDPEAVSEIFVRINSKGQNLNQSDFILTLMSVYWPEGRKKLENFCFQAQRPSDDGRPSPYNLIEMVPEPENLIRTAMAASFFRGKLKYGYLILKGRDLKNRTTSPLLRQKNFKQFELGVGKVLDLTNWHNFIKIIHSAGFVNSNLISSKITFFITYAYFLLGKKEGIEHKILESLISRWFVFAVLTQRYTGSPESKIEEDLNKIKEVGLKSFIETTIASELTPDFWQITLPEKLESSSSRNFAYLVYLAALIYFDQKVLFSEIKLRDYFSPILKQKKKTIDLHHIFPKNYLKTELNLPQKKYNQVANFIYLEYQDNIQISDQKPSQYWPQWLKKWKKSNEEDIFSLYDLPRNFYQMNYFDFLSQRRKLMSKRIKDYFEKL